MITDSSIFRMHAMGKTAGSWCTPATRGTVGRPKYSPEVHCYGHDLLGCHQPQVFHRHTQTSTEVHHPQDSSIFRMHAMGKTAGSWCTPATRGTVGRPKYSPEVHCYGHDLLGCHQPQVFHRQTQTSTDVHQPQDKASVYRSWLKRVQ